MNAMICGPTLEINRPSHTPDTEQRRGGTDRKEHGKS